jgi:hypothetical protein
MRILCFVPLALCFLLSACGRGPTSVYQSAYLTPGVYRSNAASLADLNRVTLQQTTPYTSSNTTSQPAVKKTTAKKTATRK